MHILCQTVRAQSPPSVYIYFFYNDLLKQSLSQGLSLKVLYSCLLSKYLTINIFFGQLAITRSSKECLKKLLAALFTYLHYCPVEPKEMHIHHLLYCLPFHFSLSSLRQRILRSTILTYMSHCPSRYLLLLLFFFLNTTYHSDPYNFHACHSDKSMPALSFRMTRFRYVFFPATVIIRGITYRNIQASFLSFHILYNFTRLLQVK